MEWSMLFSVVTINLLLSSDNALAIAMASRRLAPEYRQRAVRWGSLCAVVLQIGLTYMASLLLSIQYLKIVGGVVLALIAAKMISSDDCGDSVGAIESQCGNIWSAIRLIAVANLVMCLDNTLAVAAVAGNNAILLSLGILVSFPIIMWGSSLVASLLERFPVLIWIGSVFLGWTAGGIIASDSSVVPLLGYLGISHTGISAFIALGISFKAWREAMTKSRVDERGQSEQ
ncbi:YjbE family putative metal transport protein [Sporomusa sp.]|uniref:YjbE family putative metal transport protein n=1 Tax=Sporomusa sp. TaxID=2078658 RepID=UPI002CA1A672|nr:YjbE family putative metal transport protein [Sporomusa sp.]HWR44827.1 YjbE family putative metal transport protein [Sporomusa sp.]